VNAIGIWARRKFVLLALLGLPAALLAHALLFGGQHAAGGVFHAETLGLGAGFAFLAALIASVAAVRRVRWSSPVANTVVSAAIWFAAIERAEAPHRIPFALCALTLLAAAWLVGTALRAFTGVVTAIAHAWHVRKTPRRAPHVSKTFCFAHSTSGRAWRFALFPRPPPALS
jgi:hypothetical protein